MAGYPLSSQHWRPSAQAVAIAGEAAAHAPTWPTPVATAAPTTPRVRPMAPTPWRGAGARAPGRLALRGVASSLTHCARRRATSAPTACRASGARAGRVWAAIAREVLRPGAVALVVIQAAVPGATAAEQGAAHRAAAGVAESAARGRVTCAAAQIPCAAEFSCRAATRQTPPPVKISGFAQFA